MKLSIEDLYRLAADRELSTPEIHPANDYYGHATILKQYARIRASYQLKALVQHGAYVGSDDVWDVEANAPLPVILTFSAWTHSIFERKTAKALIAIGPMLSYAPHFLDADALEAERKRIGKNLLIFPAHSTHWIDANYDIEGFCQFLEDLGKEFDSIRICLGWKDILRGSADLFMQRGFECVTAGHMYDPAFLPRLRSIIELATITMSNTIGTHIGYCILMGKPHYLRATDINYTAEREEIIKRDVRMPSAIRLQEIQEAFGELCDDISPKQSEIVERYWGIREHKTVSEIQEILQTAEEMYRG